MSNERKFEQTPQEAYIPDWALSQADEQLTEPEVYLFAKKLSQADPELLPRIRAKIKPADFKELEDIVVRLESLPGVAEEGVQPETNDSLAKKVLASQKSRQAVFMANADNEDAQFLFALMTQIAPEVERELFPHPAIESTTAAVPVEEVIPVSGRSPIFVPATTSVVNTILFEELEEEAQTRSEDFEESALAIQRAMANLRETAETPLHGNLVQSYDHPILTREQEHEAFELLKKGAPLQELMQNRKFISAFQPEDRAKAARIFNQCETVEAFICSCSLRLVDVVARGYPVSNLTLRERINAGNIGLLRAVRQFDPDKEGRLSSAAVWSIRSEIVQAIQKQGDTVRLPSYVHQDLGQVRRVAEAFRHVFGRTPEEEELRQQLVANTDLSISRIDNALNVLQSGIQRVGSINETLTPDSEDERADFIPDKQVNVEEEALENVSLLERRREVRRALSEHLNEEEQQLVKAIFGIDQLEKTPEEVAEETGRTLLEVDYLLRRGLSKLRSDRSLQAIWTEDAPSFLYHMSAEEAAIRLGLFSTLEDYAQRSERYKTPRHGISFIPEAPRYGRTLTSVTEAIASNGEQATPQHEGVTEAHPLEDIYAEYREILGQIPEGKFAAIRVSRKELESFSETIRTVALRIGRQAVVEYQGRMAYVSWIISGEQPTPEQVGVLTEIAVEDIHAEYRQLLDQIPRGKFATIRVAKSEIESFSQSMRVAAVQIGRRATVEYRNGKAYVSWFITSELTEELLRVRGVRRSDTLTRVRELRDQGLDNKQIAEMLELSIGTVRTYSSTLIGRGEITPHKGSRLEHRTAGKEGTVIYRVKQLRNQGYGNQEIADMLGVSYGVVAQSAIRLLRSGQITPLRIENGVTNTNMQTESVNIKIPQEGRLIDKVRELRNQGLLNNTQIADALGISDATVGVYISMLIKSGEVASRTGGRKLNHRGMSKQEVEEERAAAKSEETEQVRQYLEAHPRPTGKDAFRRIFEGREHRRGRPKGYKTPETIELERQIKELRGEGLTYYQIADRLGTNWMRIQAAAYKLIQAGELEPKRKYSKEQAKGRAEKIANSREFGEQVRELAEQGLNSIQIAEKLEDSVRRVHFVMWRMNKEGRIKLAPDQLNPPERIGYVDRYVNTPNNDIYDKVAEMRNQGMTNAEIADVLGMSQHNVETYASNLIRAGVIEPQLSRKSSRVGVVKPNAQAPRGKNYDEIADLRNQGLNNQQVAKKLGISAEKVSRVAHRLIQAGVIKPLKPTTEETETLRLNVAELRNQGRSNEEIAQKLNKTKDWINAIAHQLIQSGAIKPMRAGRQSTSRNGTSTDTTNAGTAEGDISEYRELLDQIPQGKFAAIILPKSQLSSFERGIQTAGQQLDRQTTVEYKSGKVYVSWV